MGGRALWDETADLRLRNAFQLLPRKRGDGGSSRASKRRQIANYRRGTALVLSIHIVHHAGTVVCGQMKKLGPTPEFACMGRGKDDTSWPEDIPKELGVYETGYGYAREAPGYDKTAAYVSFWRKHFHFKSLEFNSWGDLHRTNWEDENLVSLIVMRNPLDRFLAGGKCGRFHADLPGEPTNETQGMWWAYANSGCADNYALRVLSADSHCINGANTTVACLESAQALLDRFTFVVDQTCLDESMVVLGEALNLSITLKSFESRLHRTHLPARERIGNDTLYEFIRTRFRRDIELYEWSKRQSVLVCNNTGQ